MKVDLHCHSHFSDGTLSPRDLVALAHKAGITDLALTDHDTLDGLPEARLAANEVGLNLINGIELSCTWDKQLIHIVGLNVDPNNSVLKAGVVQNKQRRVDRAEAMFEDFEQHDIFLREAVTELIRDRGVPTRPHFAQALVDQGYAKDKKQAFKRYLVRGKPGYIPMLWPDVEQIGSWITAAGGIGVLAHPNRYKFTRTKLSRLLSDMLQAGIQGMEVSTSTTDKQQSAMLADLATQFGLYASVGSDFHSTDQPWARLGGAVDLSKELNPVWSGFGESLSR
ncbi:MAG: putative metal-dependent phosphoesterase TrpH [Arenicella sp.]|jgi:predicted metal-dependent phosphoesterase TrpH